VNAFAAVGAFLLLASVSAVVAVAGSKPELRHERVARFGDVGIARGIDVIDTNLQKDCVCFVGDPLYFIGGHSRGQKSWMVANRRGIEGSARWENGIRLASTRAFVEAREIGVAWNYIETDTCDSVQSRAAPYIRYRDVHLVVLPSRGLDIAGYGNTNPRPIGGGTGARGNVVCGARNIERLQDGGSLRLSGIGESIGGFACSDRGFGLLLNGAGLGLGGIGARLNSAQLASAVFSEVPSRFSLVSSSFGEMFGGRGLGFPGLFQFAHRIGLGMPGQGETFHRVGLLGPSIGKVLSGSDQILRVLRAGLHLMQLAFHRDALFIEFAISPISNQSASNSGESCRQSCACCDPFPVIQIAPKWFAATGWFIVAWINGMIALIWFLYAVAVPHGTQFGVRLIDFFGVALWRGRTRGLVALAFFLIGIICTVHAAGLVVS
jgi:hypothetical protein